MLAPSLRSAARERFLPGLLGPRRSASRPFACRSCSPRPRVELTLPPCPKRRPTAAFLTRQLGLISVTALVIGEVTGAGVRRGAGLRRSITAFKSAPWVSSPSCPWRWAWGTVRTSQGGSGRLRFGPRLTPERTAPDDLDSNRSAVGSPGAVRFCLVVNRHRWRWIPSGLLLLLLAALGLLTRGFTSFPSTYYMTGPSMAPSVGQGAWFLARSSSALPGRGELVLWEHWIDDTLYHVLRRVVALPGDTARMVDGMLLVNGRLGVWPARIVERRAERILDGPIPGTIYNWGPVAVGPDSVFVLSDTRDMIGWPDSRFFGAVPRERIGARYLFSLRPGAAAAP